MSSLTIFQRLNLVLLLTLALLVAAVGLALWVQGARTGAALRQEQVSALQDRVGRDLLVMMDSLRMIAADPRNESERTRRAQAEDDLRKKLREGQQVHSDFPELVASLKAVGEFAFGNAPATLGYLQSRVLEVPESNTADVSTVFNSNYREVARQRELQLSDLGQQVAAVRNTLLFESQRSTLLGFGTVVVVLVAGLVLGRLQTRAIRDPLRRLASTVEQLRQGDLTKRPSLGEDGLGRLGQELDRFVDDLTQAVEQIQRCGVQLNAGASQMAATTKDQQTGFSEVAATLEQVNVAAGQIFSTSNNLVKSMQEVNTAAEQTASLAGSGQTAMARTEATVRHVLEGSSVVGAKLAALSDKTANINSVVATIAKIADQTNLLSLNAAIEAEKAGEYGLGFAVVAVEIRRLADQTAVATYDIEKTVKEMQSAVAAGVVGMEEFSEELRRGAEEVREVSAHLAQIIERVQLVTPRFQAIHGSMQTQLSDATQINERLAQLAQTVQRTGESLRNSKAALEQLQAAGAGLRASTSRFKLNAAAAAPAALSSGGGA